MTRVHVSHKHYAVLCLHLGFVDRHQTERIPAPHKLDFHVNFMQQITILKEHVSVYATHHAHHATSVSTRSPAIAEGPRDAGVPVEIW